MDKCDAFLLSETGCDPFARREERFLAPLEMTASARGREDGGVKPPLHSRTVRGAEAPPLQNWSDDPPLQNGSEALALGGVKPPLHGRTVRGSEAPPLEDRSIGSAGGSTGKSKEEKESSTEETESWTCTRLEQRRRRERVRKSAENSQPRA